MNKVLILQNLTNHQWDVLIGNTPCCGVQEEMYIPLDSWTDLSFEVKQEIWTALKVLQDYYNLDSIDNFVDYFCEVYNKSNLTIQLELVKSVLKYWNDPNWIDVINLI